MIGYVTLGTRDLARASKFYDAIAAELGTPRMFTMDNFIAWGTPHAMAGRLRPIDPQLVAALVFGPSQWLARSWLTGLTPQPPTHYADMLVDLVTRALRPQAD